MKRVAGITLLFAGLLACGSDDRSPASPARIPSPDTGIPAGSVLEIVSGETGAPVADARVVVGGVDHRSDARGRVVLTLGAKRGTLVDVVSAGGLDRQTLLRSATDTRLTVWPSTSANGLDASLTAALVYTFTAAGSPVGGAPLIRPRSGATAASVTLSEELLRDADAVANHERALALVNQAVNGAIVFSLGPPSGSLRVEIAVDELDAGCTSPDPKVRYLGLTRNTQARGEILSSRIVYCVREAARTAVATHELGHVFGLRHSPRPEDLMYPLIPRGRSPEYTPAEQLAMRLLLQRRAENRFPDNDRATSATAASTSVETIVCP